MAYTMQERANFSRRPGSPEEYVGYRLCDPREREIGRVSRLFVNDHDEPEYIEVQMGLFGRKVALLPVADVALNEEKKTIVLQ